jgi:serine/threonine-protein kinase
LNQGSTLSKEHYLKGFIHRENHMTTANYTLLFVDDESAVLKSLKRVFQDDYHVLTAENGAEALGILEKEHVHLIVSDLRMPGMDGLQLLHKVKERWPETIRVMLTGATDVDSVLDDISSGAIYRFITKPWDDQSVKLSVKLALQQYNLILSIKKMQQAKAAYMGKDSEYYLTAEKQGGIDSVYSLLFVDDESAVLKSLKRVFQDDYHVLTAENGAEALGILEKEHVHLIVSDLRMPGMDGLQLLHKVKERWPETIRVMLTGATDVDSVLDDISEGFMYKFVSKPWQDEDLKMSVRLALRQYALIKEMKQLQK